MVSAILSSEDTIILRSEFDNTERVIDTVGSGIDAIQDFGGAAAEQVGELLEFVF